MKPQIPPNTTEAAIARTRITSDGRPEFWSPTPTIVAPSAPRISWPPPPMLNMPVRNEIATARPVKISGVAATSVSVSGRMAVAMSFRLPVWNALTILPGSPNAPDSIAP